MNLIRKNKNSKSFFLSWEGIFFLLILFWFVLLFKNAFNPNTSENSAALWFQMFYIIWHIFVFIFLIFLCWGLGRKISKAFKILYSSLSEEFTFATSLGLGALSFITLILGAVKMFYPTVIHITTFVLFILTIKELREIIREIYDRWEKRDVLKLDIPEILLLYLMGLTALLLLTGTFTPPLSYDGLAYHLGVPKTYIKNHGIIPLPYHVYSNFPFNIEMLYTYSILLTGNGILAKMFHFFTTILICFSLYSFGKKYFNHKMGLLSACVFINIPLVGQLSVLCYNDLGLALFIFLSIFAFVNWLSSSEKEKFAWLFSCGIFTGLALGTKYFAITFLLIFLAFAAGVGSIFISATKRKTLYLIKNLTIFLGVSFCVFLPWIVKNFIITGNPLFPFLFPIFGGGNWTSYEYQRFLNVHLAHIFTFKEFFIQLWNLLTNPGLGLPFVFILPFIFILKHKDTKIKFLSVYAIYYYVIWFFSTHRVDRFIIPIYTFLSLIIAYIVFSLPKKPRILTGILLSIFMAFNFLTLTVIAVNTGFMETFSGTQLRQAYLEEKLYSYPAIEYINKELSAESKILFIGDNQTFYCEKPLLSNSPLDRSIIVEAVRSSKNGEDVNNNLKAMGITHIYYNASEVKRTQETYAAFDWKGEEEYTFIDLLENHTKKLFEKNGCFIFELMNEK